MVEENGWHQPLEELKRVGLLEGKVSKGPPLAKLHQYGCLIKRTRYFLFRACFARGTKVSGGFPCSDESGEQPVTGPAWPIDHFLEGGIPF